ncbi:hypothetical protein Tco_0854602 [Tanacetum coccineum]
MWTSLVALPATAPSTITLEATCRHLVVVVLLEDKEALNKVSVRDREAFINSLRCFAGARGGCMMILSRVVRMLFVRVYAGRAPYPNGSYGSRRAHYVNPKKDNVRLDKEEHLFKPLDNNKHLCNIVIPGIKERCLQGLLTPRAKARHRSSRSFPMCQEQYFQTVLQVV